MAPHVKESVLLLLWLWLQLWRRFDSWPGNFLMLKAWGKKKLKEGQIDNEREWEVQFVVN